jgi:hypothetical protein
MGDDERLAVIVGIHVGMRDTDYPVLWFNTEWPGGGSLQAFNWGEAGDLIRQSGCYRLEDLEGKTCIVTIEDGYARFKRFWWPGKAAA